MLLNRIRLLLSITIFLIFTSTFAHAERRFLSSLEGTWKLEMVKVLGIESGLIADTGYLSISKNKEISYQGLCKSYEGEIVTSQKQAKRRLKKRGRSFRFNAGFKLTEVASDLIGCLGLDEFEANSTEIFRARLLSRQGGTLKLRTKSIVFTFRKLLTGI